MGSNPRAATFSLTKHTSLGLTAFLLFGFNMESTEEHFTLIFSTSHLNKCILEILYQECCHSVISLKINVWLNFEKLSYTGDVFGEKSI